MRASTTRRALILIALLPAIAVAAADTKAPPIAPEDFSADITRNPYFLLPVGKSFVMEAKTEDGVERTEIFIPGWTKTVMGVETLVYWDRVTLDGELIEDTRDYLAQGKNGDIWYFGEHVDNYEDGRLTDHEGAWMAGERGAEPGIWLKADAKVGDKYRQEYLKGEAEDEAEVIGTSESVEVPLGKFSDCIKTLDWSPLFPEKAHKFYCRETGTVTLEVDLPDAESDEVRTGLVAIDEDGARGVALPAAYAAEGVKPVK
jgi:hypothetical protein